MSVPCEVCDQVTLASHFKRDGYQYERCQNCGLIRIHPQPTDTELEAIYQNGYYDTWGKTEDVFYSMKRKTFASLLGMVPLNNGNVKGRLLDVGAATGILMEVAREWGYDPYGVEAAKDGAESIARKFGKERVLTGYFDQIDFAKANLSGTFDIVTMIDLFEHVRDPNEALRIVNSLLRPNGLLLLYLPDTSSWTSQTLGKNWNYYAPEHLFSFSKSCMTQILHRHNFKVLKLESAPKYLNVEYFCNVLKRIPGSIGFLSSILYFTPPVIKNISIPLYVGQMRVLAQKEEI